MQAPLHFLHSNSRRPLLFNRCRAVRRSNDVHRVVVFLMVLPHLFGADPESLADRRFVMKHTVFDFIRFARIVQNKTFKVFGTGVHHLAKHVECRKNSKKRFVQTLSILNHIFAHDKHVIDIGAQVRTQVHTVLHGQRKKDFPVSPVHETLSDTHVFHERLVVHTIVHEQERSGFSTGANQSPLALQDLFDSVSIIVAVDEQIGHKLFVVMISVFGAGHDDTDRNVPFVIHDVGHECRLARTTLSNKHTHLVVCNFARIKFAELQTRHP